MILLFISSSGNAQEKTEQLLIRIVMVGDSTMATYTVPRQDRPELTGWESIHWTLSPQNARYEATIIDPKDGHPLLTRLYNSDDIQSLSAIAGFQPIKLRIQVFPSTKETVTLEGVTVIYTR